MCVYTFQWGISELLIWQLECGTYELDAWVKSYITLITLYGFLLLWLPIHATDSMLAWRHQISIIIETFSMN